METTFRAARPDDTLGRARVYLAAFPASVQHFFPDRLPHAQAVADLLVLPLLAMHPAHQGEGLGRELLSRGVDHLERQGAERIRLEVRPDNAGALRLHERSGFVTVGRTRDAQGDWLTMIREESR